MPKEAGSASSTVYRSVLLTRPTPARFPSACLADRAGSRLTPREVIRALGSWKITFA